MRKLVLVALLLTVAVCFTGCGSPMAMQNQQLNDQMQMAK